MEILLYRHNRINRNIHSNFVIVQIMNYNNTCRHVGYCVRSIKAQFVSFIYFFCLFVCLVLLFFFGFFCVCFFFGFIYLLLFFWFCVFLVFVIIESDKWMVVKYLVCSDVRSLAVVKSHYLPLSINNARRLLWQ